MIAESDVAKDVELVADSALEEYLGLKMLAGETEISPKAFPEAQNFDVLCDAIQKVTSIKATYDTDEAFWTDSELDRFKGTSNKYEYYVVNGLEVDSIEAYKALITKKIKNDERLIIIRYVSVVDQEQLVNTTVEVFYSIAEDKLDNARMGGLGNYTILAY